MKNEGSGGNGSAVWQLRLLCGGRRARRLQGSQHRVARAVGHDLAIAQHQNAVSHRQRGRTVRDQEHGAALGLELLDGLEQCGFAGIVEVGIGFIQHNELGVAVNGAGQPDALALPT